MQTNRELRNTYIWSVLIFCNVYEVAMKKDSTTWYALHVKWFGHNDDSACQWFSARSNVPFLNDCRLRNRQNRSVLTLKIDSNSVTMLFFLNLSCRIFFVDMLWNKPGKEGKHGRLSPDPVAGIHGPHSEPYFPPYFPSLPTCQGAVLHHAGRAPVWANTEDWTPSSPLKFAQTPLKIA